MSHHHHTSYLTQGDRRRRRERDDDDDNDDDDDQGSSSSTPKPYNYATPIAATGPLLPTDNDSAAKQWLINNGFDATVIVMLS
jgi:hypothetical protein